MHGRKNGKERKVKRLGVQIYLRKGVVYGMELWHGTLDGFRC